jgi:L-iditol 2-dehydrogenase
MKAIVLSGIRKLQLTELDQPPIQGANDVLLRIRTVGICGSDLHYYETGRIGSQVVQFPFVMGHECTGEVVAGGTGVKHVRPGDPVAVDPAMACHQCDQCLAGRENTCRNLKFLGCPGQAPGCLSEFIVMPEDCLFPVPSNVKLDEAVLAEPLSVGLYSVQQAQIGPETQVGILGCGPIGLSILLACLQRNARELFITDKIPDRVEIAHQFGAAWTANPLNDDVPRLASQRFPQGLDVVFECAGQPETLDQALELLKPGGRVVVVGIPRQDRVSFAIDLLRRKEITIINIRRQRACMPAALDLLASGAVPTQRLLTHRFRPEQARDAFALLAHYQDGVLKAIIEF